MLKIPSTFKTLSLLALAPVAIYTISSFTPPQKDSLKEVDEAQIVNLINDIRAKGCKCGDTYMPPADAIRWDNTVAKAAAKQSIYMNKTDVLSHEGENKSKAGQRLTSVNYKWGGYGENVAKGFKDEEEAFNAWMKSPEHCKNMMKPQFIDIGLAVSGEYWTLVLAAPKMIKVENTDKK